MSSDSEVQNIEEAEDELKILSPGTIVAERYRIIEVLGRGGMGVVYKAEHIHMNRLVAMKMMLQQATASPQDHRRFQREAQAASLLNHPNIVAIYDFGFYEGQAYLCMDYLEGKNLDEIIEQKPLTVDQFRHIFVQACHALQHAHDKGIVHRDLKPSNMLITERNGDSQHLFILDFGLVKMMENSKEGKLTMTNMVLGSPLYMSPEQCRAMDLDQRSDIYSLACVMYEALTGFPPLRANTVFDMMNAHISETPQSLREAVPGLYVPAGVERVILQALAKNPADRPQSMKEFAKSIESSFSGAPDVVLPALGKSSSRISSAGSGSGASSAVAGSGVRSQELAARKKKHRVGNMILLAAAICIVVVGLIGLGVMFSSYLRGEAPGSAKRHFVNKTGAGDKQDNGQISSVENKNVAVPPLASGTTPQTSVPILLGRTPVQSNQAGKQIYQGNSMPYGSLPPPVVSPGKTESAPAVVVATNPVTTVTNSPGNFPARTEIPSIISSSRTAEPSREQLKNMASTAFQSGQYDEAKEKLLALREDRDPLTVGRLAVAMRATGDSRFSEYLSRFKDLARFNNFGDCRSDWRLLRAISEILGDPSNSDDYDAKENILKTAKESFLRHNRPDRNYFKYILDLNKIYRDQNKTTESQNLLRDAKTEAQFLGDKNIIEGLQMHLSQAEQRMGAGPFGRPGEMEGPGGFGLPGQPAPGGPGGPGGLPPPPGFGPGPPGGGPPGSDRP